MPVGVIGMTWTKRLLDIAVIFGTWVGVAYQQGDGSARREPLIHAGYDLDLVGLIALSHKLRGPRSAPVQIRLDIRRTQGQAGWATIDHATDRWAMGFTKVGDRK